MCGITGISYSDSLNDVHDIKLMSDTIAHRGPDGEGFLAINSRTGVVTELGADKTPIRCLPIFGFGANADIYLAHRRLSIIDLSAAGHQPMSNKSKDIWIIFNGEIYNYKSLKNELKEFEFKSNADTEVLLYTYEKWGIESLKKLNGMWSFVIYDAKKNILFGSRDRFGIKPLYYTNTKNYFAFNSEIKGLLAKPGFSHKANLNVTGTFLNTGSYLYDNDTFFKDISELQPSHYFIFNLKNRELTVKRYYDLKYYDKYEKFNEKKNIEYINEVKKRVFNAVDLRLNADVTIGSCLSGGLDSSSIVCTINNLLKTKNYNSIGLKQGVVTACYNNSIIDESNWAKIVSDHVSADWHKVFPQKEELEQDLSDLVYSQDFPFGSTSIYAQYRVMKTAKEAGLKVMLDGQGGDELFTGYTPYYNAFYIEAQKNKDYKLLRNENTYIENTPLPKGYNIFSKKIKIKKEINFFSFIKKLIPQKIKKLIKKILGMQDSSLQQKYIITPNQESHLKKNNFSNEKSYTNYTYTTLNQMLYTFMSYTSLPTLLKYEDRNSMRFSIESRTPFADDINLIEYVFSIPSVYKIHNGWSKYLLRESMSGIIPDIIKKRTDKIGFETPEYDWLKSIKPFIFNNNNNPYLNEIINIPLLEKKWDELFAKQNKRGITDIWILINYILWFNIFKVTI